MNVCPEDQREQILRRASQTVIIKSTASCAAQDGTFIRIEIGNSGYSDPIETFKAVA